MNDNPIVEDLLILKLLPFDINFADGNIIGQLARQSVQKNEKTVRLLRFNNPIGYMSNINPHFQSLRCPNFDTFCNKIFNLERLLTGCSE